MHWEYYLVMERLKKQEYQGRQANNYSWRTTAGRESILSRNETHISAASK